MRKTLLSISCLLTCMVSVQAGVRNLGTDRQVNNRTDQPLSAPDMDIAFNGWIYNAHQSGDSITIKISKDHGLTWKTFTSLCTDGESYGPPAIVVAGKDVADLHLFIAGIRTVKSSGTQRLFLRRYNAANGAFEAEPVFEATEGHFYACDLATDYNPISKATQSFSVSLLYAAGSTAASHIVQKVSADGGVTFPVTNVVATGNQHYRNVSICYGRSTSASNGRYFMAWDEYSSEQATLGNIYTSRSAATVLSAAIPPVRIDQTNTNTAGKARRPVIAASTGIDNDSSSCTAVILMEAGTADGGTAIYSVYNKRPHFTNHWNQQQLSQEGTGCIQPALTFDATNQTFAASYYDKKGKNIHLLEAGFRQPQSWQSLAGNYADNNELSDPHPCIAVDPLSREITLSWAATASGHTIYFDVTGEARCSAMITDLRAAREAGASILSWTGNGTDGSFSIERSTDRLTFDAIANMPAVTAKAGYYYKDATAPAGEHYYRIRYSTGAGVLYSKIVSAVAVPLAQEAAIRLYPNPVAKELHLSLGKEPLGAKLIVTDITGKTVLQMPVQASQTTIDVHHLPAGTYYVRYSDSTTAKTIHFTKIAP